MQRYRIILSFNVFLKYFLLNFQIFILFFIYFGIFFSLFVRPAVYYFNLHWVNSPTALRRNIFIIRRVNPSVTIDTPILAAE
jgi:hypothetical protein